MKTKRFFAYWLAALAGVLLASYYPLSMGVRVVTDMIKDGRVLKENYPKYVIPYTPLCLAILFGVLILPLCIRWLKKGALIGGGAAAVGVFFLSETLLEQRVVVSTAERVTATLQDWQMFMCYVPAEGWGETVTEYKTQTPVEILMGEYDPAFKLHFYLISVVLILAVLNGLYGFGQMIRSGERGRRSALILQSGCALAFLGLCILACFTAFYRDGNLRVSPLSAALMALFFVLLGVTVGVFVGSFLLGRRPLVSVWLPSAVALLTMLLMYIGEMILLNGHLYLFGAGWLFDPLPGVVLAPADLLVVAAAGGVTALLFARLNRKTPGTADAPGDILSEN